MGAKPSTEVASPPEEGAPPSGGGGGGGGGGGDVENKPTGAGGGAQVTEPVFLAKDLKLAEGETSPPAGAQSAPVPVQAPAPTAPPNQSRCEGKIEAIADYKICRTLGQGAYGKVKMATNVNNGHNVAVKVIDRSKLVDRPQGTQHLVREINTMKILRHQNVVRLYEVIHTPAKIFMVMEYAEGGDLLAYLNANGRLSERRAAHLFSGMIEGLHFCHRAVGVCHRDLKLENLLLADDVVKIADFGMAALAPPASFCKTLCGSPDYAAPEILREVGTYDGELSDAWSAGVILYALLCRRLPFQAHQGDIHALFESIKTGDFAIPPHVTELPADLIRRMLETEPSRRWSVAQARAHGWCKQARDHGGPKPIKASVSMDGDHPHPPRPRPPGTSDPRAADRRPLSSAVPRNNQSTLGAAVPAAMEGTLEHWRYRGGGLPAQIAESEPPKAEMLSLDASLKPMKMVNSR